MEWDDDTDAIPFRGGRNLDEDTETEDGENEMIAQAKVVVHRADEGEDGLFGSSTGFGELVDGIRGRKAADASFVGHWTKCTFCGRAHGSRDFI